MKQIPHTPGPWFQSHRKKPDGMHSTEVYDAAGETIASIAWYPVKTENGNIATAREANARLIAVAPKMADVLREILRWANDANHPEGGSTSWFEDKILDVFDDIRGNPENETE
jgi:hypothetical protein